MALPVFAPFPPPAIRSSFAAEEWQQCLSAWNTLTDVYLHAENKVFKTASEIPSFSVFLRSYYEQWSLSSEKPAPRSSSVADTLKRNCFLLVQRCYQLNQQHELISDLTFLSHFSRAHLKSSELSHLLELIWQTTQVQKHCQRWIVSTTRDLENGAYGQTRPSLGTITPLLYSSQDLATYVLTGLDFLDSAMTAYVKDDRIDVKKTLVIVVYLGLISLVKGKHANTATLSDQLYILKSEADSRSTPSLLADLVTNTPLLKVVQQHVSTSDSDRTRKLIETLHTYKKPSIARKRKQIPKQNKGKQRMPGRTAETHVHQMSLVTQIQDLFPDLGAGFVLRLLDEYNDNVEEVTAHLLEDSLPRHLSQLNRKEQASVYDHDRSAAIEHLAPRSTPPIPDSFIPNRANAFDGDDFDRLEIDASKFHIGKKPGELDDPDSTNKAAILAALAAFDSDDDERDDTYDIEDVGGTVDTAHHDGDDTAIGLPVDENDMVLYKLYERTPEIFSRSAETRRSKERASLKAQTGMADEAIEGWAIMLQRDPKRARRLALEANKFDGKQNEIARSSYRAGTDTEDSDVPDRGGYQGRGRGGYRGRGRGRGGSVAGPSGDAQTAAAQRRKEANKGSRANHNRRDQRARKMARGGFSGPS